MTIVQRQVGCVVLTLYGFKSSSFFKIFGQLFVLVIDPGYMQQIYRLHMANTANYTATFLNTKTAIRNVAANATGVEIMEPCHLAVNIIAFNEISQRSVHAVLGTPQPHFERQLMCDFISHTYHITYNA